VQARNAPLLTLRNVVLVIKLSPKLGAAQTQIELAGKIKCYKGLESNIARAETLNYLNPDPRQTFQVCGG